MDHGWQEVDMSGTSAPSGYVHPTFAMAHIVNPVLKLIGSPTLTVRGRRSGLPITIPLAPFDFDSALYLVGGGGETQWVRNLRSAGEGQLRMGGKHQDFRSVEIQGPDRDRIVNAYRKSMGRRFESYFRALPNPADHPVFRVEPVERD
jgi:deazaflavin-dependent oxidoreductase (nitroreductase family)